MSENTSPVIYTERLILREYVEDDIPEILTLAADPVVKAFIANLTDNDEEAWSRILRCAGHWRMHGFGAFAVVEAATQLIVGEVGLATYHREIQPPQQERLPEASWLFTRPHQGKGYAREAMLAVLGWFDKHIGGNSICIIEAANSPSLRLADSLGYSPSHSISYRGRQFITLLRQVV